jgi:hypothetical protein
MKQFFIKIYEFLLCLLREDCEYSIKKFLSYVFSALSIYVIIFTDKQYYDILGFIAVLLGIRAYEKSRGVSDGAFTAGSKKLKDSQQKEVL